jgi:Transcriptional regulators
MAIKAKDLAQQLGVSQATISLLLNNKAGLSEKTRQELTQRVVDLGFGYMFAARGEYSSDEPHGEENLTEDIAFVIYKRGGELMEQTPFLPLIMDGLEATARKYGYRLTVNSIVCKKDMRDQMAYLKASGCKGVVVFATEMVGDEVDPFHNLGIPLVLLDNYYLDRKINAVTLNNEQGTYALVNLLYKKGHRKIGYLTSGLTIASFTERKEGFFRALRKFDLEGMEKYCFDTAYPEREACLKFTEVIKSGAELPTAFLTDNDVVAYGAVKAMVQAGIRVPQDVSVVGFDDRPICLMTEPPLTTVRIPRFRFGGEAVELLVNKISQAEHRIESHVKVEVCVDLVERESVADIS